MLLVEEAGEAVVDCKGMEGREDNNFCPLKIQMNLHRLLYRFL
jgi:hypothetical protein